MQPQALFPEIEPLPEAAPQLPELAPRQYAADLMRLPRTERLAALHARVPRHLQPWVEHYVRDWTMRRSAARKAKR